MAAQVVESDSSYMTAGMLVMTADCGGGGPAADPPPDGSLLAVPAEPVTRSFGMMLVGMTPSTHDGRRKLLAGVDGGELTGDVVTRSGADPLRFDAATDAAPPHPSSSDGFPPAVSPPGRVEQPRPCTTSSSLQHCCNFSLEVP